MSVNNILFVMVGIILASVGCSTPPGCLGARPGTVGSPSPTSSGKVVPNSCQAANNETNSFSALIYSLDSSGSGLNAARVDNTGDLVQLTPFTSPTLPVNTAESITIVNKSFVYIPMGDTTIQAFSIDRSTGALTTIPGSPYLVPTEQGIATASIADPQGRFLFVGSRNTGEIWGYTINPSSGALTLIEGSPFTAQFTFLVANSLAINANGMYLYVGQIDPSLGIMAFSIDQASGALIQVPGSPFHLGVAQLHADPVAEFLLGTAQVQNQSGPAARETKIYTFALSGNGVPTPVPDSPFTTEFAPYDFMIVPNGQFVYTFGVDHSSGKQQSIEGFQRSIQTGALTPLSGSPYTTLPPLYTCQLTQTGGLAVCIDGLPGTKFSLLSINTVNGAIAQSGADLPVNNAFPFAITE